MSKYIVTSPTFSAFRHLEPAAFAIADYVVGKFGNNFGTLLVNKVYDGKLYEHVSLRTNKAEETISVTFEDDNEPFVFYVAEVTHE